MLHNFVYSVQGYFVESFCNAYEYFVRARQVSKVHSDIQMRLISYIQVRKIFQYVMDDVFGIVWTAQIMYMSVQLANIAHEIRNLNFRDEMTRRS